MDTTRLASHYPLLTAWERLALTVAADGRGDEVELERLINSAPMCNVRVSHHWGLADALARLAMLYVLQQMDQAFWMTRLLAVLERQSWRGDGADRLRQAAGMLAYRIRIHAQGWRLLCVELRLESESLLRDLPGADAFCEIEVRAEWLALSREEALAYQKEVAAHAPNAARAKLETAADTAQSMRQFIERGAQSWS